MNAKKKSLYIIIYVVATVFILSASSCIKAERNLLQAPKITWKVEKKEFVEKQTLISYQYIPIERLGKKNAYEMIRKLQEIAGTKMRFDQIHEQERRLIINSKEDSSAVFDVEIMTGAFLFNTGLKKYAGERNTPGLPLKSKAPELALEHLAKLKYLPKNSEELVVKNVGGLGMSLAKEGKISEKYQKLVTVLFGRVLDGVPVQGRGSRIVVHLGDNASLVGLIKHWPEVKAKKIKNGRIKNDDLIREEINSRLLRMAGQAKEIIVREARLVLFDDGRGVIEPAVYVVAAARYDEPERVTGIVEIPVDFYVPTLMEFAGYYPFQQDAEAKSPNTEGRPGKAEKFKKDEQE